MSFGGRIVTLGDSHALFSFAGVGDAIILWRGPVTMHRAARDGLASLMPSMLYYVPRRGDTLILSFGEIDCREHIPRVARRNGTTPEHEIDALCDRFSSAVEAFRRRYPGRIAISSVPPHLQGIRPSGLEEGAEDHDARQVVLRRRMNDRLRGLGLPFIDFTAAFETPEGLMRPDLGDGFCHILPARSEPVVAALAAVGLPATFAPPPDDVFLRSIITRRGRQLRAFRRVFLAPLRLATRPLRRWIVATLQLGPDTTAKL